MVISTSTSTVKNVRQRGMALITVLLIIALGVSLINIGAVRSQVAIKRVENNRNYHQMYQYALASESWAIITLQHDTNGFDSYQDNWANIEPLVEIDDAKIHMRIDDEQSKFNLNNLSTGIFWRNKFIRFLRSIDIKNPEDMYQVISDYIDINQVGLRRGDLEVTPYRELELPYRAIDRQLNSVDELLGAAGIDKEALDQLRPYVTAFPLEFSFSPTSNSPTNNPIGNAQLLVSGKPINVLTCDLRLFNLLSRNAISDSGLAQIQSIRQNSTPATAAVHHDVLDAIYQYGTDIQPKTMVNLVDKESNVFSVTTTVELGGRSLTMYSLLYRISITAGSRIQVIERRSELN